MSIFPKILLATDGSESSELAARTTVDLSKKMDSELHVVYVAHEHHYVHAYYDLCHQAEEQRLLREDRRALEEYVDHVQEAGGTVAEAHLRVGDAAKEIVELAEELNVGLVALGSRGHGPIRRALLGSVSVRVLKHVRCSVLIVRGYGGEEKPGKLPGKLLVAIDGSEEASAAARAATEIASATDSELRHKLQAGRQAPDPPWQSGRRPHEH